MQKVGIYCDWHHYKLSYSGSLMKARNLKLLLISLSNLVLNSRFEARAANKSSYMLKRNSIIQNVAKRSMNSTDKDGKV